MTDTKVLFLNKITLRFYMNMTFPSASFIRTLIPFMRVLPSLSNHLQKVPPLNIVTIETKVQHNYFGRTLTSDHSNTQDPLGGIFIDRWMALIVHATEVGKDLKY